jgi:hypothetical protein
VLSEEKVLRNTSVFWLAVAVAPPTLCIGTADLRAAPTQAQQDAIRSSCQSDYRSYCASVPTGGSAALQCLENNVASLSPTCQQAVKAASGGATTTAPATTTTPPAGSSTPAPQSTVVLKPREEIALMRQACGADYRAYCDGVRIVGGGALSCLVSHASSLSPTCKGVLGKLGQKF